MAKSQRELSKKEWEEENARIVKELAEQGKLPSFEEVYAIVQDVLRRNNGPIRPPSRAKPRAARVR